MIFFLLMAIALIIAICIRNSKIPKKSKRDKNELHVLNLEKGGVFKVTGFGPESETLELTVIDKTINPDTVLKVNSVAASNTTLTRTNNVYTGYITLNNINNGLKPRIVLQVQWENDENINDLDREIDSQEDYILINFKATQYKGS